MQSMLAPRLVIAMNLQGPTNPLSADNLRCSVAFGKEHTEGYSPEMPEGRDVHQVHAVRIVVGCDRLLVLLCTLMTG